MDTNKDGVISFEEWRYVYQKRSLSHYFTSSSRTADREPSHALRHSRDFLLFLPANQSQSNLRTVLSYYSATGNLSPEGDVHINEPILGAGTANQFPSADPFQTLSATPSEDMVNPSNEVTQLGRETLPHLNMHHYVPDGTGDPELEWLFVSNSVKLWFYHRSIVQILTESTPHIGYFLSGGMAGAVSRTATAPFDRLKVYLIAQTKVKSTAANIARAGSAAEAAGWMAWPIVEASKDLWRAGGIRSLFAGLSPSIYPTTKSWNVT